MPLPGNLQNQDAKSYSKKRQKECKKRHQWDSNPQSLPPESNALPLGHGACSFTEEWRIQRLNVICSTWYGSQWLRQGLYPIPELAKQHHQARAPHAQPTNPSQPNRVNPFPLRIRRLANCSSARHAVGKSIAIRINSQCHSVCIATCDVVSGMFAQRPEHLAVLTALSAFYALQFFDSKQQ